MIRDRFGIKQLYYHYDNNLNQLTFCSEIKGIFANEKIKKEINFSEIHKVLNLGLIDSSLQTCFLNINKVPCGSYLEFSNQGLKIKSYYKIEDKIDESKDNQSISYKEYSDRLTCNAHRPLRLKSQRPYARPPFVARVASRAFPVHQQH